MTLGAGCAIGPPSVPTIASVDTPASNTLVEKDDRFIEPSHLR
jgi:hypothetical protein